MVVRDGLGFFTSRIVTTYSSETMNLLAEGVAPQLIDNAATNAGFSHRPGVALRPDHHAAAEGYLCVDARRR